MTLRDGRRHSKLNHLVKCRSGTLNTSNGQESEPLQPYEQRNRSIKSLEAKKNGRIIVIDNKKICGCKFVSLVEQVAIYQVFILTSDIIPN